MVKSIAFKTRFQSGGRKTSLLGLLVALAMTSQAVAAPGAAAVSSMTSSAPGGFIFDGSRVWVADAARGLCRMDPGAPGPFILTNCVKPSTGNPAVPAIVGQPAFDPATGFVYLPDRSSASKGIWRYHLNNLGAFDTPVNTAANAGLGGQRPGAISFGPVDGSLYTSMAGNSNILRVTTPAAAAQTVTGMTTTKDGKPAAGLAILGAQLWIAETDGVLVLPDAVNCGNKCKGALNTQLSAGTGVSTGGFAPTTAISFDPVGQVLYLGTPAGAYRYNPHTGAADFYSGSYVKNAIPGLYSNVTAVGVDNLANLFLVDDPTAGQTVGGASIYTVPAGSLPDGQGGVPQPPPTVRPTVLASPLADPASQFVLGSARTGAIWMGTHVWVTDATLGLCRVDPALPAPSLTACAVLPVGFAAGAPAFDKVNNWAYVPDTTAGGAGIVRLLFNPASETVGAATTVVPVTVLTAAAGAGATAPTSLAFGPDSQLYSAMGGTNLILRVTAPSTNAHTVAFIGNMNDLGAPSLALHNADLWDAEKNNASTIFNATLCKGTCAGQFFAVILRLATSVASDGAYVYIGDSHLVGAAPGDRLWRYDPVNDVFQIVATNKLMNGAVAPLNTVSGIALDGAGGIYAVDADGIWKTTVGGPALTAITPGQAQQGASVPVIITGSNLTGATLNMPAGITASGVTVTVSQITATFTVAANAPVSTQLITVTTPTGVSNPLSFQILPPAPVVTSIAPATGVIGASVPVLLTGSNLGGATLVLPLGITATGVTATATTINATFVIAPTASLGPQGVSVTTAAGTSNTINFSIVPPPPTITSISPLTTVVGANVPVTIVGTNLLGSTLNLPASITTVGPVAITATQITATFAISATAVPGPVNLSVTTAGGATAPVVFTINPPPPAVTSITPALGGQGTTIAVTLAGANLTGATLNGLLGVGITATGVTSTATQVTATFAIALTATLGPQNIIVSTAGGSAAPVVFTITPPPPPVLTSITPASGMQGASVPVTLAGTFLSGATLNLPAGVTTAAAPVVTATQITATLAIAATAATGALSIAVTTPGGASGAVTFTVNQPAPVLTTIAPNSGGQASSVNVTLTGTALTAATTIGAGPGIIVSNLVVVNATSVTATFAISGTAATGPQNVTITTPGGASNTVVFTINAAVGPTISAVNPALGVLGASVPVTITGVNLTAGTLNVPAGITASNVVVVNDTTITATFVGNTVGPQSITVTSPTAVVSNALTFTVNPPPPTLSGIVPALGVSGASVGVTISGTALTGATLNLPAGITATGVTGADTQITATLVIAANAASGGISVTTPFGGSNALAFTVNPPAPTLTGIVPTSGAQGAAVAVTLSGTNLSGAALNPIAGITISGVTSTATSVSATFTVAAGAALGPQNVTVTTAGGASNAVAFTINPPAPTLAGIAPTSGTQGAAVAVVLSGTSLSGAALNPIAGITISGVASTATSVSATFTIAAGAALGPQNVTVTTAGGASNAVAFTISPSVPTLAGIAPTSGTQGSAVAVTLTGTNLLGGTINPVAGITISNVVVSSTQITATFAIAANATLGNQNITVTTAGGATAPVTFAVLSPAPVITALNQPFTRGAGNQGVTLTGTSLTGASAISAVQVFQNGAPVPVVVSAVPVAGSIIVQAGTFQTGATQLRWNWTIPTTLPASSGTQQYTISVTTPSGASAPFAFTVQ